MVRSRARGRVRRLHGSLMLSAIVLPLFTLLAGGMLVWAEVLEDAALALPSAPGPEPVAAVELFPTIAPTAAPAGLPLAPTAPPAELPAAPTPEPGPTFAPLAEGDLNLVLLGSDRRPGADPSWRTDAIILVAIRPQEGRVGLLSIPRDLWIAIPGQPPNRINTVDYLGERLYGRGGGLRLLQATLGNSLGIPLHGYARVNFDGLCRIVDALGGVTITSDRAFDEWLDEGTPWRWRLQVVRGTQHMDGRTALGYARSRKQTGDLDRGRRQQQILLAMRDQALSPAILPRLPGLVTTLAGSVQTDVSQAEALSLLKLVVRLPSSAYRRQTVDGSMVRSWVTPQGAMVLLPDWVRIRQAWREVAGP